jgi:uncharacterized protein with HEPN domain
MPAKTRICDNPHLSTGTETPSAGTLLDMVEMCDLLIAHASDDETLATDPVVQAAAQRWIEVLGEAATHLSEELRSAHPEIPWREIIGTRVILAHAYFYVDQDIIGDVVKRDVPAILHGLQAIVDSLDPD